MPQEVLTGLALSVLPNFPGNPTTRRDQERFWVQNTTGERASQQFWAPVVGSERLGNWDGIHVKACYGRPHSNQWLWLSMCAAVVCIVVA